MIHHAMKIAIERAYFQHLTFLASVPKHCYAGVTLSAALGSEQPCGAASF
jgi:hypothetical protein